MTYRKIKGMKLQLLELFNLSIELIMAGVTKVMQIPR